MAHRKNSLRMDRLLLAIVTLQFIYLVDAQSGGESFSIPPYIVQQPNVPKAHFYTQSTSMLLLRCIATGYPSVRFIWQRNGMDIVPMSLPESARLRTAGVYYNSDPLRSDDGTYNGSMVIIGTGEMITGTYQCFAALSNAPKTRAMSERIYVHRYDFKSFDSVDLAQRTVQVAVGEYLSLPCPPLDMRPLPLITWGIADMGNIQLIDNRRIIQDDEGMLHILNVVADGNEFAGVLQCSQENREMSAIARGRSTLLAIPPGTTNTASTRPPKIAYNTKSPAYIIGDDESGSSSSSVMAEQYIYCIFSGYPTPDVEWSRADGQPLGPGLSPDGPRLIFRRARTSDSGTYVCTASNSIDMVRVGGALYTQTVTVNVYTKPRFQQVAAPILINKTVDDDIRLDCSATGTPAPAYQWYINSVPEKESELRTSGQIQIGYEQSQGAMKIFALKKEDSTVISCNVSNQAGYLYRTYVLNVLNKTRIVSYNQPPLIYANRTDKVTLTCTATADASLPLEVYWKRQGFPLPIKSAFERGVHLYMADGGRTANLVLDLARMNETDQLYWAFSNSFECVAETSLVGDRAVVNVTVSVPDLYSLGNIKNEAELGQGNYAAVQGAGFELWMIGVLIAIIVLVALIIGVVFAIRRQKGGSYLVDAKERAQGNDPLKELKRDGFADYVRPDQDPTQSSRATLDDVENAVNVGSDDEDSMGEYGQVDTAKFDEDGSFIDQYGTAKNSKKKNKKAAKKATQAAGIPLQVHTGGQAYAPIGSSSPHSYFTSGTSNGTLPPRNGNGTMPARAPSSATPTTPSTLLRGSSITPSGDFTTYPTFDIDKTPLLVAVAPQGNGTVSYTLPPKAGANAAVGMQQRITPPVVPQRGASKVGPGGPFAYNTLNRLESTSSSVATLTTPNGAVTPASATQYSPNANVSVGIGGASGPHDSASGSGSRVSVNNRSSLV